jgi:hypothetical protein
VRDVIGGEGEQLCLAIADTRMTQQPDVSDSGTPSSMKRTGASPFGNGPATSSAPCCSRR